MAELRVDQFEINSCIAMYVITRLLATYLSLGDSWNVEEHQDFLLRGLRNLK